MTVEKLKRVLWRVRERHPGKIGITNYELRRAIMYELGTDQRTYKNNRKALIQLGWIKSHSRQKIQLTDNDLTGD